MISAISGNEVVKAIIWVVCIGMVFWLLYWLLNFVNPPEPFKKVGLVILAIASVILLINVIMTLGGHPLYSW